MRGWQSSTLFCVLAVWSVIVLLTQYRLAVPQTAENISFRWAFGSRAGVEDTEPVAITQDTVLRTGGQFKMVVKLQKPCFVYVLHRSSKEEMAWLFPYNKQRFATDYQIGKRYDIPQNDWYTLDPPVGRETIYLLASTERLSQMEALLDASAAANPAERLRLTTSILAEIRARQMRPSATPGERPGHIAGNVRGKDVGDFAVEISAQNFYSKTFTIEHQ